MSLLRTLAIALNIRGDLHHGGRSQARDRKPSRASGAAADSSPARDFTSFSVTAPDGLLLHVRIYGSRTPSALPVVCLPGLARTAADFHRLAMALTADPAEPRWVLALDYRGHGQSEYDRNPENYGFRRDLADLSAVLTALNVAPAIFVGTSHGGMLAMMLARSRPAAIAGVVLNDIGPVIEPRALLQIKGYMGKLPVPRNFREGGEILRKLFAARFPKLTAQDWIAFAQRTWREHGSALVLDYDVRLSRTLQANLEHSPPTLWDEFDALADVPLMIIRGANSTMLTSSTLDEMLARRGEIDMVVVPDQGHAPLLEEPKLTRRIAAFVASCDMSNSEMQAFSVPTDGPALVPETCSDGVQEDFKPELGPRVSVPSTATLGARSVAHVVVGEPAPSPDHAVGI
jgi:pimeloyl-ACP methyl ester carboxylesterase